MTRPDTLTRQDRAGRQGLARELSTGLGTARRFR